MSFGQTLRAAREAKGLSTSQVANETHILIQIVEDMENEVFKRIPAPIYGRGFIRLFAEAVGLEPAPLIQEYMDIINGRRRPSYAAPLPPPATPDPLPEPEPLPPQPEPSLDVEAPPQFNPFAPAEPAPTPAAEPAHLWDPDPLSPPTMVAPEPEPAPAIEPMPEPEPAPIPEPTPIPEPAPIPEPPSRDVEGLPLFGGQPTPPPAAAVPPTPPAGNAAGLPPQIDASSPFLQSYDEEGPSVGDRFRAGLSELSRNLVLRGKTIPRRTWRISLLVLAALAMLALIVFGCIKLYQATARPAADPCANGTCEVDLTKKPTPANTKPAGLSPATPAPVTTRPLAPAAKSVPAPRGQLRTTGQKVPSLYMD